MFVDFLKCIHLILTLGLLGSTFVCLILVSFRKSAFLNLQDDTITLLNQIMLWLLVFAILTGTLLIYPKHFTFHTPWVQAAYLFVFLSGMLLSILIVFRKKRRWRWIWGMSYGLLIIMLVCVVHDAITKTSFLC
ncbi:MAG TPA: hypothetical protein VLI69_01600 [Gammaproteobacteria bacterium]|nr:hypothetical protein [Gammaproteobacteria bacterium]